VRLVPYLISALVTGAGVVVLLTLLMRLIGPARRLVAIIRLSQARLADRCALLTARLAALRVELARRRHPRDAETPSAAPTA
jgi:threonine dehydrogenase-like Zn-dependent dehydrogenase